MAVMMPRMRPLWILAMFPLVSSAGDESKRVPSFSGERCTDSLEEPKGIQKKDRDG